jgi:hypothetical protein
MVRPQEAHLAGIDAQLHEAESTREPLELIFAVRGTICRAAGKHNGRWRLRTRRGHVVTFRPEFVVAVGRSAGLIPSPGLPVSDRQPAEQQLAEPSDQRHR